MVGGIGHDGHMITARHALGWVLATTLVTLADLNTLSGASASNTSSNTGRQGAFSSDGQHLLVGSGVTRPGVPVAGAPNDTGADLFQIRYVYTFSKRTEFTFLVSVRVPNSSPGRRTERRGGARGAPA